jgi:hypothetical protein
MYLRRGSLMLLMLPGLCLFWLSPLVAPRQAHALSDPITVTARSASEHFPDYIDFYATANDSASTIYQASLNLSIGPEGRPESQTITLRPQQSVQLHWREMTTGSRFLPPGTPISYYWLIWDSAGTMHSDTTQQFMTIDTRFAWQHLTQGLLQVNWYSRSQDFGQIMLNQANNSVNRISGVLGGGLNHPINLWIYANTSDFQGSLEPGSYEWVGGEARPALNEAAISVTSVSDDTLVRDMPHELTHLIFHQLIAQGIYAPTWFDEGLAVYNQVFHESEMSYRFRQALNTQSLLRLDSIAFGFPSDSDKAYLAYAESWNLVSYMYATFGQAKMAKLIQLMNDPIRDFDEDLQQALGEDHLHLENAWRLHLNQPAVLSPDMLTPTPNPVLVPQSRPQSAVVVQNNYWPSVGFGGLLVLVALGTWMMVLIYMRRNRGAAAAQSGGQGMAPYYGMPGAYHNQAAWQQRPAAPPYGQAGPYRLPDAAAYTRDALYGLQGSAPAQLPHANGVAKQDVPLQPAQPPGYSAQAGMAQAVGPEWVGPSDLPQEYVDWPRERSSPQE